MPHPQLDLTITCLAAPFQVEGTAWGIGFGFRSRHGSWALWTTGTGVEDASADGKPDIYSLPVLVQLLLTTDPWKSAFQHCYDDDWA
jgi:hypothetical protein